MIAALAALAGCENIMRLDYDARPTTQLYTEPAASGLRAVRPYPTAGDVCIVAGENTLTRDLLDHTALLIACPKHERGAIADRLAEGATIVAHARHCTLLRVPN